MTFGSVKLYFDILSFLSNVIRPKCIRILMFSVKWRFGKSKIDIKWRRLKDFRSTDVSRRAISANWRRRFVVRNFGFRKIVVAPCFVNLFCKKFTFYANLCLLRCWPVLARGRVHAPATMHRIAMYHSRRLLCRLYRPIFAPTTCTIDSFMATVMFGRNRNSWRRRKSDL